MKGKIYYKVKLTKEFSYPKSMLEKGYEQEDARNKAYQDIHKTINEITNNKFEDVDVPNFFQSEVREDQGWKLREDSGNSSKVDINSIIDHFANADFEKKFGILNIEENPDIFTYQPEIRDGETILQPEAWYLTEDKERELKKIKTLYKQKLRKFTAEISDAPMPRRNPVRTPRPAPGRLTAFDTIATPRPNGGYIWGANMTTGTAGQLVTPEDLRLLWTDIGEQPIPSIPDEPTAEQTQDIAF